MSTRQCELENRGFSLANILRADPSVMVAYPFVHSQSFSASIPQGSTNPAAPVLVNLLGFINADLYAIAFHVVQQSYVNVAPATQTPALYAADPIQNIVLALNGINYYNAPLYSYKIQNMRPLPGSSAIPCSFITPSNQGSSSPYSAYFVYMDFTRNRNLTFPGKYQNTLRIPANTMTLQFNTSTTNSYFIYATYFYSAICEIGQNGQSAIYFS